MPVEHHTVFVTEEGISDTSANELAGGLRGRIDGVLIPEGAIHDRVIGLAREIVATYPGVDRLILLVVLKGAFVFAADLARAIAEVGGPELVFEFVRTQAYGNTIKSDSREREEQRTVSLSQLPDSVNGADVLLVDDIVDQGLTLGRLKAALNDAGATSLKICTLLSKRLKDPSIQVENARARLKVDFVGFDVPDVWVAGYGIDAAEDFRSLPFIVVANKAYYTGAGAGGSP